MPVAGQGVIITAKGYPDLATRRFLHLMHSSFPHIPFHALVDFDPDGIAIMRTYKLGSRGLSHEGGTTVPTLSWLGLRSSDILGHHDLAPPTDIASPGRSSELGPMSSQGPLPGGQLRDSPDSRPFPEPAESLMPLTLTDRRKAARLIADVVDDDNRSYDDGELVHELQVMLLLNIKAEIQAVDDVGCVAHWLNDRLLGD
ncbi:hypothetical protein DL768_005087 [Monosporascus sp. mg162]|nr:hypothetical protein DL768_005087 [Monosporascus sp. mg162]